VNVASSSASTADCTFVVEPVELRQVCFGKGVLAFAENPHDHD
jgi:hypothetical protein